ncbi:MAG: hypothetical protein P4K98_10945 [Bryobacteraceae bacterium]|nr:hypothetical protein [Bryobacteraceae bacterium]
MNLRTWARILIAVSFSISGLVETFGATGLVVELSPDGRWGSGIHTVAVSGPLQLAGAAILASGRKTRWALIILGGYVFLAGVFGNLPLIFNPAGGGNALTGLAGNVAVLGGILFWFYSGRIAADRREGRLAPRATPRPVSVAGLVLGLIAMGGVLYWLHSERTPAVQRAKPMVPVTTPAQSTRLNAIV